MSLKLNEYSFGAYLQLKLEAVMWFRTDFHLRMDKKQEIFFFYQSIFERIKWCRTDFQLKLEAQMDARKYKKMGNFSRNLQSLLERIKQPRQRKFDNVDPKQNARKYRKLIQNKIVELEVEILAKKETRNNQKSSATEGHMRSKNNRNKKSTKKRTNNLPKCRSKNIKLRECGLFPTSLTSHRAKNEACGMLRPCDKNHLAGCLSERSAMKSATQKMKDDYCTRMTICAWGNKCTGADCTKHMNCDSDLAEKNRIKDRPGHQEESSFDDIWKCIDQKPYIPRSYSILRNPTVNMLLTSTLSQGSSNDNPPSQASSRHNPLHHPTNISGISWENFERETMRVASFSRYPISSPKSASVLANSGFVYVGEGRSDKVICYFCNAIKENWKSEEDVETVHKQLSPQCPMVTITESNNTATLSTVEGATSVENYRYSSETNSDQAITAAASGYDYRQQPRARPASINSQQLSLLDSNRRSQPPTSQLPRNTLSSAAPPQNGSTGPQSLHPNINSQIYSIPRVPLSVPAINPPSQPVNHTTTPLVRDLNLQDLGIFYERPKKPEYAILTKRLETFQGWPLDCPVSKENVAKAGLYYEGYGDSGRCFFCGGGLRKWEQGDDPFVEHARWYPKCGYIRQYKGQAFVDIVQIIKDDHPDRKTITLAQVVEEMDKLGVTESNAFEEDPVEHDAAVKSLLDEIQSPNSALQYTKEEVIQAAQILRNQSIALSSDLILSQLTQKHDATDGANRAEARAASGASNTGTIEELKDQNSTLRNNLICKICMDKEVKIVFLPCGHLVSCQECAVAFHDCPICRSHIRAYVRANIR